MNKRVHYAWIVLGLAFLSLLAVQGVRSSFGAFIQPWEQQFAADRSTLSFVAMISFAVYGLSQPIIGRWLDKRGVRIVLSVSALLVGLSLIAACFATSAWHLALLYGGLASIGFGGASGVAASVAVTRWFHSRRGLALGIITAGTCAGQLILVPASLLMIEAYGWQWTAAAVGAGLCVAVAPLLYAFLRDDPARKGLRPYGAALSTEKAVSDTVASPEPTASEGFYRTRAFWFLALPYFACGFTTVGLMDTHLIPYAHEHGFSAAVTGTAVSVLAAFNVLGTLASGQIADRFSCRAFLALLYGIRTLSIALLLITDHPYLLFLFAALFGLVDFATVAPTTVLAGEYFSRKAAGTVLGWLSLSHQIGSALGAYIPGLLHDWTGSYYASFLFSIGLLAGAAGVSWLLPSPASRLSRPAAPLPS